MGFTLLLVVLAGLGTAHILVRTANYGLAVVADSTIFLSTAINFLAGEGWRDFTGTPLVLYPPLFPLLLAAGGWVGIEPFAAGRWVNATAFGLTILAAGGWLRSNLRSQGLALAATATLVTALPLNYFAASLMTDFLFALFTLLALIQWTAFLHRRTDAPLRWAAVFTALAALTRYPGVVLIGTGVLLLLLFARRKQTLVFGAISSVPLLAVLAYNWTVSETLAGKYRGSGQSLSEGLRQTVEVFREWIVPPNAPEELAYLLGLAVAAVGLAGAAVVLRALYGGRPDPAAEPASFRLGPALPFGVFVVSYLLFIIVIVSFRVGPVFLDAYSRYLLPVYVPLLLAAMFLLDRFLSLEGAGRMAVAKWGLASLVLLGLLAHGGFSVRRNLRLTTQAMASGYPAQAYNAAYWQHSETLNYIKTNLSDSRIHSNNRYLVWFWDRTAAPRKYQWYKVRRSELPPLARNMMRWTKGGTATGAYIVRFWMFHNRGSHGYDAIDLRLLPNLETVAELSDGDVFRVTAVEPFDAEGHRARKQRYLKQLIRQAGEPIVRADWDVYRNGRKLIWVKDPCTPADVQAKFVLHVAPADPADLPVHRKRYGSDNLDFHFGQRSVRRDDQCIAIVQLPDYPIGRIWVGQWISNENRTLWEAEFSPDQ